MMRFYTNNDVASIVSVFQERCKHSVLFAIVVATFQRTPTMETRENLNPPVLEIDLVKSLQNYRPDKITETVLSMLTNCSDWSKSRVFLFSIPSFKTF